MRVVIRGAGDLASGIALRLWRAGLDVVLLDVAKPTAIRRTVAFSEAIVHGEQTVEDVTARLAAIETVPELLRQVCAIEELRWVRVLYCYPDRVTDALLDEMARQPKVCRYLDIPVQHGSAKVLREMNRRGDRADILALAARIREKLPGAVLRTTVITGFPGETEEDFTELCSLVQEARFDRLGCFVYSREEDTPAGEREDQVDPKTARRRADIVMELQQGIAFELSESQVGRTLEVLVEGRRGRRYVGRSYMDAPDIDTRVLFDSEKKCLPGDFIHVIIEKADGYDLFGRAVE